MTIIYDFEIRKILRKYIVDIQSISVFHRKSIQRGYRLFITLQTFILAHFSNYFYMFCVHYLRSYYADL